MAQPEPKATPPAFDGPKLLGILKQADKEFQTRYEFWNHQSRVLRARYTLLLEQGFTEAQAIQLCTQDWSQCI